MQSILSDAQAKKSLEKCIKNPASPGTQFSFGNERGHVSAVINRQMCIGRAAPGPLWTIPS